METCEKCKERETSERIAELEKKVKELEARPYPICTLPHYPNWCTRPHVTQPPYWYPWITYTTAGGNTTIGSAQGINESGGAWSISASTGGE